jgi:assimilatory nitrate reductase catalytic subunit
VGCGVTVNAEADGFKLTGNWQHPANFGRLCVKGVTLGETLGEEGRLLHPQINGRRASWDDALNGVADAFKRIIESYGPDSVAFYVSGQLLTEDYYVANKLMKGFIGSANIDTNSRLCMSSAVAAQKRAFGADAVPVCYQDIELADLVVIAGANYAWAHPVLYQRLAAAKRTRPQMRVVVIDPRRTATCDIADLHLAILPGSDAFLFNGLLHHLRREDALDLSYIEAHVDGFAACFAAARESGSVSDLARKCGLDEAAMAQFFNWFAQTERTVTIFSQGINQSSSGVDKGNAIINLHLATGRIGRPGMGPFSVTGQPNAMGGREVGGLANQLASHMDFTPANIDRLARFWGTERTAQTPGLKAVEMFEAINNGAIRAIWIMGTNPVVSMPDADQVRQALQRCDLVVVSDCVRHTDTTACAHILLPAQGWGEKDGTVSNSERCISRQRAFKAATAEAMPDWWIITQLAQRMGFGFAFPYKSASEIFREHARLSGFENNSSRAFDISGYQALSDEGYDAMQPAQWPITAASPVGTARLFEEGNFYTSNRRAQMVAIAPQMPVVAVDKDFPMILNTGRLRDQWHTMTRTALVPRLNSHACEPVVEMHESDVGQLSDEQLVNGQLARLVSRQGSMLARVQLNCDQRPGSLFVPMHWSDIYAKSARVDTLTAAFTDPVSGQPEFKHTPVRIESFKPAWQGFALSRMRLELPETCYCAHTRLGYCWRYEIAGESVPDDWHNQAMAWFGKTGDWMEYKDAAMGRYRAACIREGKLDTVFFIARDHQLPEREWLIELFGKIQLNDADLSALLTARAPKGANTGRNVCACFGIGEKTIKHAIETQKLTSIEAVGEYLKAGTGCGSCVPEIRRLLNQKR